MTDIMLDLETLGRKPGCVVLSIGAVVFDPKTDHIGERFYQTIDVLDSIFKGFEIDQDTLDWWVKQNDAAKWQIVSSEKSTVVLGFAEFEKWFRSVGGEKVWCHGATFDAPIMAHTLEMLGYVVPWKYSNVRDTRTIYDIFNLDLATIPSVGTHHNALDDAIFQVKCVQEALRCLRNES